MKLRLSQLAAVSSAIVLLTALPVKTARRPRYGGTLRVEIGTSVKSLDPAVPAANSEEEPVKEQIDSLIYDVIEPKSKFTVNGAFHVTAFEAGKRVVLAATEDYRLGRPFVDSIEITMGRAARERIVDLELNKADFAEIPAEDARRAAERGVRVSRSQPDELLALVFPRGAEPNEATRLIDATNSGGDCAFDRSRGDREFYFAERRRAGGRAFAAVVERDGISVFDGG